MDIVERIRANAMLQEAWDRWELGRDPAPDPLFHGDTAKILRLAAQEIEELRDAYNSDVEALGYYKVAANDRDRLVRELDVALNGEDGAAKRPALCDVVSQVKSERWKLVRTDLA